MMVCDSAPMLLRRSRSELDSNRRSCQSARSRIFDNTKSHHSTLDSIYSKNSIIQKEGEDVERNSYHGRSHMTKSIYSNVKRCRSEADAGPEHSNICGDNDNRSLCSFHSVKSVFQRAQDNYQTIIGSNYPLSKVTSIWKALSEFIEQQLKTDKATVIPKLGVFTIIETNLQGHTHKKPVFIINKTLLKMHDLKSKEYGVTKAVQRSVVSYLEIATKCSLNRFVVEEVISEVIKSFEKLLMTKRNCELPFFQIGKLQVQAGEIRMKFYEDFIKTLNRSLFRSQSCCSLISGISKLSRTSSAFSKMTSLSECYRPTSEFHCVLPLTSKGTGAEKPERNATACPPQMRKSQSCCSLESRRTKDTQSLLSIPNGSSCSKRSCCLQQATREAHGDDCMCIICESRQRGAALNDIGNLILQGNCEVERRKNILIEGTSKVKEIESRQRLEVEKTSKQMQEDAARYNRELAVKWDGRRPKRSTASRADNDLMFRRPNSECERRKNKISNVNEIIAQIKQKKSQEKCQKLKEEESMKERNDKLTQLLYEERVKNIKEKNCKRDQMKQGLDDQLQDKRNKPKDPSVVNFDSQLLRKTPLRNDMSSFSQLQIQKGRYKTQGEYQKVQMKEKKLREEMEKDDEYDFGCKYVNNIMDEIEAQKQKDLKKRQQDKVEKLAMYKEACARGKPERVLEPMGFLLNDPLKRQKCVTCTRRVDWINPMF